MNIDQQTNLAVIVCSLVVAVAFFMAGCAKPAQSSTQEGAVKIELLFGHDGVRVYRFKDYGNPVYFTSKGDIQSRASAGKTTRKQYTLNGAW